jgi:hypothetical protein
MRFVGIATAKNEIDIIEAFVRHTLAFVDQLVVLDNGSTDGTLDILRGLVKEGLPLEVVEDAAPGYYQSQRMTRLMREFACGRYRADWVVALDADEFLVVPEGGSLIPPGAGADRPVAVPWRTYVATTEDDKSERNPVERIRHRRVTESPQRVKVVVPAQLAAAPAAIIRMGNHGVLLDEIEVEALPAGGTYLAHFPSRSPGQSLAKIVIGALQLLMLPNRATHAGWDCLTAFERVKRDLRYAAAAFAESPSCREAPTDSPAGPNICDPLPYRGGPLVYTPPLDDGLRGWQAILLYAEGLAFRQRTLAAFLDDDGQVAVVKLAKAMQRCEQESARQWRHELDRRAELDRHQAELYQSWTWRIREWVERPVRRLCQAAVRFGSGRAVTAE